MNYQYKEQASGKWRDLSFFAQMANIGSEVERAISWRNKGNKEYSDLAFKRALELLDLTLADIKNRGHLKELARVRECLVDYFVFDNEYNSTDKGWQDYFFFFFFAARVS